MIADKRTKSFKPAVDPACAYLFADGTELVHPHDPTRVPAALDDAMGPNTGESWRRLPQGPGG